MHRSSSTTESSSSTTNVSQGSRVVSFFLCLTTPGIYTVRTSCKCKSRTYGTHKTLYTRYFAIFLYWSFTYTLPVWSPVIILLIVSYRSTTAVRISYRYLVPGIFLEIFTCHTDILMYLSALINICSIVDPNPPF